MFSFTGLNPQQTKSLVENHHVYLTSASLFSSRLSLSLVSAPHPDVFPSCVLSFSQRSNLDGRPQRVQHQAVRKGRRLSRSGRLVKALEHKREFPPLNLSVSPPRPSLSFCLWDASLALVLLRCAPNEISPFLVLSTKFSLRGKKSWMLRSFDTAQHDHLAR